MSRKWYYRCRTNPKGPLLELNQAWEAKEMKRHPDYDEVDEFGLPVIDEDDLDTAEKQVIPFTR